MVEVASIRAVLFAKDLSRVANFYSAALGMTRGTSDESHTRLERSGFELIIHQIPQRIADTIEIEQPPVRRVGGSVRLDYPVENIDNSRAAAKSLGGDIDELPPAWADRGTNFYLGHDPEGNVFGVSEQAA
jgi:predicted enzyme related to lactoylglutathione lyase